MRITEQLEMLIISSDNNAIYPTLIWDENNLVLVDACFPQQMDLLEAAINKAGYTAKDITKIILTHQDLDHIGCAIDILGLNPDVQIIAHEEEAPYIDGRETPIKMAVREANRENLSEEEQGRLDTMKESYKAHCVSIGKTVTAGEILACCGGIKIIHTPGHTPGHICLYVKEGGILIAGDALNLNSGALTRPNPVYTYNMELAVDSLRQLKNYDIHKVITYHGGLFEGNFQKALCAITQE